MASARRGVRRARPRYAGRRSDARASPRALLRAPDEERLPRRSRDAHGVRELHFRPIRYPWTNSDVHCHFLDACKFRGTCRYVHWELDVDDGEIPSRPDPPPFVYSPLAAARVPERLRAIPDPQWIRADLKRFDLCLLGDFAVVLVDPPWNIGIDLPYDTMSDADMRNLGVEALQTEGYLFLWVTEGRWSRSNVHGAVEVSQGGRARLDKGEPDAEHHSRRRRTGHFLNLQRAHAHRRQGRTFISARAGRTTGLRRPRLGGARDIAQTDRGVRHRRTIAPGAQARALRQTTRVGQPGWVAVGNQLDDSRVVDESMASRVREAYPTMRL